MSDEEYERFEITDYDLDNEFNPNRNRRRPTKNQAIYGIWADNSGDSDDSGPELGGRRGKKSFKDYSKPLNFVAGGVQQAGKKTTLIPSQIKGKGDDENDEGEEENEQETSGSETEEMSMQEMAGFRTRSFRPNTMPKGVGDWEAHTKGIGSKLLQKMGYEPGKGLGRDLQGINAPVQAFVRKGRGAIGAYGPEKAARIADQKQPGKKKLDEDERETLEFKEKMSQWRQGTSRDQKRKVKYVYRTVEDVIAKGQKSGYGILDQKMSQVTVIDMTGPEKRVLSGYHALGQAKQTPDDDIYTDERKTTQNFTLPELMHNLGLLVDMSEQEIIAHDRKQRAAETRIAELEQEKENLHKIVELEQAYLTTLESAVQLVQKIVTPSDELTLEQAEETFVRLKVDYPTEFKEFQVQDLVPGIIAPLVNLSLREWDPFEDPTEPVALIKKWMSLLETQPGNSKDMFDPYSALIWSGIVPRIRSAANHWNPRSPHIMASLLDTWAPLLPEWILDNILEQMVLAKITFCVNDWNPLTDHVPIHSWIHPWVQLLGTKMQTTVYPIIRDKLSRALKAWSPEDRSARLMILPWKGVFAPEDMEVFLAKNIVPKLELRLQEFVINPLQQDLEIFYQVWEWNEILSLHVMVHLLDRTFFPKWMQILVLWLNQNPNYDQVSRWYQGWKNQFNEQTLQHPQIKDHFRRALDLMSRACGVASQMEIETPTPPPAPIISDQSKLPSLMDIRVAVPPQLEFKEIVSQRCAERGIIFAPMPGRRENGKQVYRVGKLFCYIASSVCVVSQDGGNQWNPMSVQQMIDLA